jgi:hypothetical protein
MFPFRLPPGVVRDPGEWDLFINAHLSEQPNNNTLVFVLGFFNVTTGDELIENLAHCHRMLFFKKIRIAKAKTLHHSDPFPRDAFTEYLSNLDPGTKANKELPLTRKLVLMRIDDAIADRERAELSTAAY